MDKDKRYVSVKQSLLVSSKEVRAMRSGKLKEPLWDDFYSDYYKGVDIK